MITHIIASIILFFAIGASFLTLQRMWDNVVTQKKNGYHIWLIMACVLWAMFYIVSVAVVGTRVGV